MESLTERQRKRDKTKHKERKKYAIGEFRQTTKQKESALKINTQKEIQNDHDRELQNTETNTHRKHR